MTHRHFGNPSGARNAGGSGISRSAFRADTQRDPYPLPAGSMSERNPFTFDDRTRERAALSVVTVVFSLVFAIPLILAGIMMGSR